MKSWHHRACGLQEEKTWLASFTNKCLITHWAKSYPWTKGCYGENTSVRLGEWMLSPFSRWWNWDPPREFQGLARGRAAGPSQEGELGLQPGECHFYFGAGSVTLQNPWDHNPLESPRFLPARTYTRAQLWLCVRHRVSGDCCGGAERLVAIAREQLPSPPFLCQCLPAACCTESVNPLMPVWYTYFQYESTRADFCCLQTRTLMSTDFGAIIGVRAETLRESWEPGIGYCPS